MSTYIRPLEVMVTRPAADDDSDHIVCHCTADNVSACGLDVSDLPLTECNGYDCPLCVLAWPDDAVACPWGCTCPECGLAPP